MLNKIRIQRFRSILDLELADIEQFNLIVGDNDSGKTSILEAIFLIMNPIGGHLAVNVNLFRGISTNVKDFLSLNFFDLDINKSVRVDALFDGLSEKRTMLIQISDPKNFDSDKVEIFNIEKISENNNSIESSDTFEIQYEIDAGNKRTGRTYLRQKGDTIETKFNQSIDIAKKGIFIKSKTDKNEAITWISNAILEKKIREIIKILKIIEPNLEDITLSHNGEIYCDVGMNKMIPIGSLGEGIFRTLYILSVISIHPKGYVIIDEIENGLHYKTLKSLWNSIIRLSRDNKTQIFASTHSMDCISAFIDSSVEANVFEGQKKIYRIQRSKGLTKIFSYDYDVAKITLEKDMELR